MTQTGPEIHGATQSPGSASGRLLLLTEPLSFWGGVDGVTGRIIDQRHPMAGTLLAGRVLAMPAGRGSSSSSSVLAEAIRNGSAPAAIILEEPDLIIALGACVARLLYGIACPVVTLAPADYATLEDGQTYRVDADDAGCVVTREYSGPL